MKGFYFIYKIVVYYSYIMNINFLSFYVSALGFGFVLGYESSKIMFAGSGRVAVPSGFVQHQGWPSF